MPAALLLLLLVASCAASPGPSQWTVAEEVRPEFFFAEDVAVEVRSAMTSTLDAGIEAWGNFGPIEYWVVGKDVPAAESLAQRYCDRRVSRGDMTAQECAADVRRRHEMRDWAARAAEIEATGQPFLEAGWNGGFEWGLHQFSSSLPPGWAGLAEVRIEDDQTVLLHEYFHAVQQSHVTTLDWEERQRLMGPVWFVEGAAEYMAQRTGEALRLRGRLPTDPRFPGEPWRARDRMAQKMRSGLAMRAERPGLALGEIEYGPDGQIAYDLGAWAIAWLCHRAGPDVLIQRFYPRVEALGWSRAFEEAFGLNPAAFYAEFDLFLELGREQQLAVLASRG